MSLFHAETMQHISLFMRFDDAPLVSVVLAKSGFFDPSRAKSKDSNLPDKLGHSYRRIFNHAVSDWKKSKEYLAISSPEKVTNISSIDKSQLLEIDKKVIHIWKSCLEHKEQQRLLDKQLNSLMHLYDLLEHYNKLDINLDVLKDKLEFLDVRLGIIPSRYTSRLKQALAIEAYYLSVYAQQADKAHVIVTGLKQTTDNIQLLLNSASFQLLEIPDEFHENPKIVRQKLNKKHTELLKKITLHQQQYILLKEQFSQDLIELGNSLTLAKPFALLSKKMLRTGQLTEIEGWVPLSRLEIIKNDFEQYIKSAVVVELREPKAEEYHITPSYVSHPQWLSPFIHLIANFGVPRYKEFDPSWFFTLSYLLMFGLMFGDVGHGLSIIAIALLVRKKWPVFSSFFLTIGFSSTFFGFIYGSIFSYEHILPALWLSPMEQPMLMLKLSLLWGAIFIIMLNLISIYNRVITLPLDEALLNPHGVTGLCFYLAILWAIFDFSQDQISVLNFVFISIPLVTIFAYYLYYGTSQIIERLLISVIETYGVIIVYFSNTISFLRVAAFTLNHSALAIALFTMANMSDAGGYWLTIILGNLFILILEGAIVAIQVLRLEYYEGFSRFFAGDGYAFKPLELSPQKLLL
ncbi:MAG: V-type ATPase 116kDa subunit family protein [Pseudomonadota bacterium]